MRAKAIAGEGTRWLQGCYADKDSIRSAYEALSRSNLLEAENEMKPDMGVLNQDNIVEFIGSIFDRRGSEEYLGELVTMGEHMLQGASIAESEGQPEEIIVGALLHDIGHFTGEFGTFMMNDTEDRHHEDAGAVLLEKFSPKVITDCCRYHVAAKRYLCATQPEYFGHLSEASIHSLNLRGGPMTQDEVTEFERTPISGKS